MPVFSVKEVASAARKDEKTIRQWCAKGFVPGAKRKRGGAGRHWRIEGTNAATIAGLSLRAARGYARNRKRSIGGKVVPAEMLRRVEKMKARQRARRDPELVLLTWAAARGETFGHGELTFEVLMRGNPAEILASALAHGLIESGKSKDAASVLGDRLGWSRATFYRKFGNLLPMARRIADSYNKKDSAPVAPQWDKQKNEGRGGYAAVEYGLDESILSPEQVRLFNSMATYGAPEL